LAAFAAVLLLTITSGHRAVADVEPPPGDAPDAPRVFPPGKPIEAEPPFAPARPHWYQRHRLYPPHFGYYSAPLCLVSPLYPWVYPYPPYSYDPYYGPPLYVPAEGLSGRQALARLLAWDAWNRRRPPVNVLAPEENADDQAAPKEVPPKQPNPRGTNQEAVSLGWRFIGYGDAHFADGKYSDAYQRYRKAVQAAPQLAAGYFRQGYALAAIGRYDLAAKALKRGLALDAGWPASGFSNDELYGQNELAKTAHLDAMAKAAQEQPNNADLMFLLGVYFHFDGDPDRAAVFFRRAAQLTGVEDAHLKVFLRE
jgi:tetratricopeptide (TPR) repeat protein